MVDVDDLNVLISGFEELGFFLNDEIEESVFLEDEIVLKCDNNALEEQLKKISESKFYDTHVYNPFYFEQIVSFQNFRGYRPQEINIKVEGDGITYEVSQPSLNFIIASFKEFFQKNTCPSLFLASFPRLSSNYSNERLKKVIHRDFRFLLKRLNQKSYRKPDRKNIEMDSKELMNFENLFESLFHKSLTVKINSNRKIQIDDYKKLLTSFIFSINYNRSLPLIEFRFIDNIIKPPKRLHPNEIEVPKRIYNQKPLYYYQQALATDNPVLEFLSFYQVIEYFYEIVSQEDLIEGVKRKITHPQFSSKNKNGIKDLVKYIKGSENRYTEQNALHLVLKKYLNKDKLKKDLKEYDYDYYHYLINENVNFADAPSLKIGEKESFIYKLAQRIYMIRNSLIHSKEGEKNAYIPFSDNEEELIKQLILMRFVAEQIIINDSDDLHMMNI